MSAGAYGDDGRGWITRSHSNEIAVSRTRGA
jgi:hypothetical protein